MILLTHYFLHCGAAHLPTPQHHLGYFSLSPQTCREMAQAGRAKSLPPPPPKPPPPHIPKQKTPLLQASHPAQDFVKKISQGRGVSSPTCHELHMPPAACSHDYFQFLPEYLAVPDSACEATFPSGGKYSWGIILLIIITI